MIVAGTLHSVLPSRLLVEPRWLLPTLEALLLVALIAVNPTRMTTETKWSRIAGLVLVTIIIVTNVISLGYGLDHLSGARPQDGRELLLAAGQVWITNMIAFGLAYWELDRGGPVLRTRAARSDLPPADFRFPQDEDHDAVAEVAVRSAKRSDWSPGFLDYLYVSTTNSSAFSPTDTMPLSHRAKMLMATESVSALLLSVIVIARGVSLLK